MSIKNPLRLPRAPMIGAEGFVPSPDNWNTAMDGISRADYLVEGPGIIISEQPYGKIISAAAAGAVQMGLIVCYGPEGEANYNDARYWVTFAKCTNTGGNVTTPLTFAPDGTNTIKTATNLFEFNSQTHNVPPGTPVVLFQTVGDDGLERWEFIAADESPNGQDCEGSGSGSVCYCINVLVYDCPSKTITSYNSTASCGNNTGFRDNVWSISGTTATTCTWTFPARSNIPCPVGSGDCSTVDGGALCSPGNRPDPPTQFQLTACCEPQNECFCIYRYLFTCDGSGGGSGELVPAPDGGIAVRTCGNNTGFPVGSWQFLASTSTQCGWIYVQDTGVQCIDGIPCPTGDCNPTSDILNGPTNPNCCTGSGSGSGSPACFDIWQALILCGSGGASVAPDYPQYKLSECNPDPSEPIGVWTKISSSPSDPAGSCRYQITVLSLTNFCVNGTCTPATAPGDAPTINPSDYAACCNQNLCLVPCCPSDSSQNYALVCIGGIMQWVTTTDCGSGS